MSELAAGAAAPPFTLPRDGGATVSLADYKGGPDGKIARKWTKVKVDGRAEEVLAAAKTL
jgi:peroxiredoxin